MEARVNELIVQRALVNNGASVNLMPTSTYHSLHNKKDLVPHKVMLTGFSSQPTQTLGFITIDLQVGPIRGPTRLFTSHATSIAQKGPFSVES